MQNFGLNKHEQKQTEDLEEKKCAKPLMKILEENISKLKTIGEELEDINVTEERLK